MTRLHRFPAATRLLNSITMIHHRLSLSGPALHLALLLALSLAAAPLTAQSAPPTPDSQTALPPSISRSSTPPFRQPTGIDHWRNRDLSYRYAFELAGGVAVPAGSTRHYQNTAGSFRLGFGANLNKYAGVMLEYDFNNFGVPGTLIRSSVQCRSLPPGDCLITGRVHLWSITLNPILHFYRSEASEAYVTGGGGFYRKLVRFNTATAQHDCASNCLSYPAQLAAYSNNAGGADFGLGISHRMMYESKVRAFAEARYVWVDNYTSPGNGVYTPAYYRTGYFPVVVGLKW